MIFAGIKDNVISYKYGMHSNKHCSNYVVCNGLTFQVTAIKDDIHFYRGNLNSNFPVNDPKSAKPSVQHSIYVVERPYSDAVP